MNTPNGREGHAHPLDGSVGQEASINHEEQLSLEWAGDDEAARHLSAAVDDARVASEAAIAESPVSADGRDDIRAPASISDADDAAQDALLSNADDAPLSHADDASISSADHVPLANAEEAPISNADDAEMAAAFEQGEAPIAATIDTADDSIASTEAESLPEPILVSELPQFVSAPAIVVTERESLGTRLKRSRELQGIALADAAKRLRIPAARLAELESDAYDRISAPIYVRGYLKSYARLLGLPDVVVTAALQDVSQAPPALVATQTVSRSRYLASRYGNPVVYAVLTAVVVVPLLWAARQGSLMPQAQPRLEALDAAPIPSTFAPANSAVSSTSSDAIAMGPPTSDAPTPAAPAPGAAVDERRPVMATMTPMPSAPSYSAAPVIDPSRQQVTLTLAQASWVELIGADGTRIEYALLPAGTTRTYAISGTANLRIGNTRGATLAIDGKPVELAPHTRSNVARVALGANPG